MKMEERPDLPARFFKVILPSVDSQRKLRIPDKFVGKYGHELSDVVRLVDPISAVSYVRLEKTEKTLWLCDGWEKFVDDHFISYGYFLLFKYRGNSTFNVNILDLTATEVDYSLNNSRNFERTNHCTRISISEKEENSNDESVEVLSFFPRKPNECGVRATNSRRHHHQTTHDLSFSSKELAHEVKRGKIDAAERSKSQHCYLTRNKCKIEDEGTKTECEKPNITIKNVQETIPCTEDNRQSSSNGSCIKSHSGKKAIDAAAKYLPKGPSFAVKLKRNNLYPHFWMMARSGQSV
ncbi:B3 domain-containing transcription factor VRN1-like isoform X2 [Olea europaea var. sylvestris]|uniref:B3 domain-containing transcription factor VRN1-like isoform X2 n=1 Tax=Olea europaea var. sylvestris TaxID=158386 RepID=UPI000C1D26C8|nr:B3 domain-containing transcription factor VRN1-like isoform X2 [Olea europaea var. sylvestris]